MTWACKHGYSWTVFSQAKKQRNNRLKLLCYIASYCVADKRITDETKRPELVRQLYAVRLRRPCPAHWTRPFFSRYCPRLVHYCQAVTRRITAENMTVRRLMTPVEQFPRISDQALFMDVILALQKSQEAFLAGEGKQRILLVEDTNKNIVGKISPKDVVRGLEPKYDKIDSLGDAIRYGVPHIVQSMKDEYRLWQEPLADLCRKAGRITAGSLVNKPDPNHAVHIDERMDQAIHLFVATGHDALYVLEKDQIVGLLRFSDVYAAICDIATACHLDKSKA